ncbi:Serine acetyltransferase [Fundidesulfovibrio magnetotacticus]|uniref:serine O-acetyltransferase n=1 Tax=Fundidesulfovibrio magnetotacticus TaxID=2730080 RepID=A0A6V8LKA7_9BACT|nr:serine O-acetyltransferase EpsC [Fundidesulfovibrio magnetotacticus]GFK93152.1 Serine acetyltransferase [Fundidesulfovibrio magnetotacticus]
MTHERHVLASLSPPKDVISGVVERLCAPSSYQAFACRKLTDSPMPSLETLSEIMDRLKSVLFPGYYGDSEVTPDTLAYHTGANLDVVFRKLADQIKRGFCFVCVGENKACTGCEEQAMEKATAFLRAVPDVREKLVLDVQAAYDGDPAAKSPGETIFCYPSVTALIHQRVAHELHRLGVDIIPRIITEMAHSATGIDIHPGASIGKRFFIDHGTGVVVGETCVIGDNVRLYQGVTLGAKSFPKDDFGNPVKGLARHPIVEDDVIIYSGATVLGRITVGKGAVIGANVWVTSDVPPGARVMKASPDEKG